MPRLQSVRPGDTAEMFCHVTGEPFPDVIWLKNDEPLNFNRLKSTQTENITAKAADISRIMDNISSISSSHEIDFNKYEVRGNGSSLKIFNIDYSDTGKIVINIANDKTIIDNNPFVLFDDRCLHVSSQQYRRNRTGYQFIDRTRRAYTK